MSVLDALFGHGEQLSPWQMGARALVIFFVALALVRPLVLREAIRSCRNGGIVSVIGVYGGFIDKFPMNAVVNRSLTIRAGQTHVHRYMRPLLERIMRGDLDPAFIITHKLPLQDAPRGYEMFLNKQDGCMKVVLSA